ncbi:MAG TPA: hypothetical protein V6C58_10095 [Allocoleopsis sp.]
MKKIALIGLTALTLFTTVSIGTVSPQLNSFNVGDAAVAQSKPIQLTLAAEKQVTQEKQGKRTATWQPIASNYAVTPGEVLRYKIIAENSSDRTIKNLVVTSQRIPKEMVYVIGSATVSEKAKADITYSVDNGKTFTKTPKITIKLANGKTQEQPAPATAYTHVRWKFDQVSGKSNTVGFYQLRVK